MKRDVELARKLLEGKGYKVSKKMNESSVEEVFDKIAELPNTKLYGKGNISLESPATVRKARQIIEDSGFKHFDGTYDSVLKYKKYKNDQGDVIRFSKNKKGTGETWIVYADNRRYSESKKMNEGPTYSGHDVSDDLQQYMVTIVTERGDGESGILEPDWNQVLVSAMDEDDARRQLEDYDSNSYITDVHLATEEEIAEWEADAYNHMDESTESNSDWVDITDIIGIKQPPLKRGDRFSKGPTNDLPYVVQKVDGPYIYFTADFEKEQKLSKMHASNVAIVWRPSEHRYIYAQGRFKDNAGKVEFPIPKEVQSRVSESKKIRESTDDRQQRRIVKNIADEVIRAKGENNSTGTYDAFIRKMMDNWANSGQDRDFIKAAIEKSFDKEYGKKGVNESSDSSKGEYKGWTYEYYKDSDPYSNYSETKIKITKPGVPKKYSLSAEKDPKAFIDTLDESSDTPHTEYYKGYSIQSYDDYGATVYKNGKKIREFENIDDAREYIDGLNEGNKTLKGALLNSLKRLNEYETIYITKPDDLVGKPSPKFKVTYSTAPGETTSLYVEAIDEESAKAIIRGRCRRRGKNPKFISVEKASESLGESLDYEDMKYWNPSAIGAKVADELGIDATQEEIEAEISKILDRNDSKFQRAVDRALREIEWDKESMSRDPMEGHKYKITGAEPNVTETGVDYTTYDGGYKEDPRSAVITWLENSDLAPTRIAIYTNKNSYAQELLQWVVDNEEEFRSLCTKYRCPYKIDYMIDGCKKKLERPSNFETKYNYPDQIYPFALG